MKVNVEVKVRGESERKGEEAVSVKKTAVGLHPLWAPLRESNPFSGAMPM